jgi:hypothetical protein
MTDPVKTPEAVGFREDEDGVDMVFDIGSDRELRMIVPAEAAIAWGQALIACGTQVKHRRMMREAVLIADAKGIWHHRTPCLGKLDS